MTERRNVIETCDKGMRRMEVKKQRNREAGEKGKKRDREGRRE